MADVIQLMANLATIAGALLAFYLFISTGPQIRSFFRILKNLAHQSSLAEIRHKLELLNALRATESQDEIVALMHDVCGQIDGSPMLREQFSELTDRIRRTTSGKRAISEPMKRSLISELRERLRHSDTENISDSIEGAKK